MTNVIKVIHPFPYLKIENLYSTEELELIAQELDFLTHPDKLEVPLSTGTAKDSDGNPLKENRGLFLDEIYSKRNISNILKVNRKIFNSEYLNSFSDLSFGYQNIKLCNYDSTLVNYYENGGYYKPHCDSFLYTAVTWFFREPRLFEGGDFYFSDYNEKIEIQHNMVVIFPSFVKHSVEEVKMMSDLPSGYGRYSMSQFIDRVKTCNVDN